MDGCVVVGGIIGIKCSGSSATILNTIIDGPSGDAVSMSTAALTFCGNTAYNAGGNGLIWSGTPSNLCFVANNYFDTLVGAAAVNNNSGTATGLIRCVGNAHYACTPTNGFSDSPLIERRAGLGQACTSPDSNFALKLAYYGLGFPGVNQGFENISSYQGYTSFGAVAAQFRRRPAGRAAGGPDLSRWGDDMLLKNVAAQGIYLFAYDTVNNIAKTGDASNITGHYSLDGAAWTSFATTNPTEIGGGVYWQPLLQAGTNGNACAYCWTSTTTGIQIDPVLVLTTGVSLPTAAGGFWWSADRRHGVGPDQSHVGRRGRSDLADACRHGGDIGRSRRQREELQQPGRDY